MTAEMSLERAISDYLAVSRSASLYGPDEYEEAEARAWERMQAAIEAAGSEPDVERQGRRRGGISRRA